jgi:hypothetical protein
MFTLDDAGSKKFSNNVLTTTADLVFIEGMLVVGLFFTPIHACCFVKEREIGARQLLHVMGMQRTTYLFWTLACGAGWLLMNMLVLLVGSRFVLMVRVSTVPSLIPLLGVLFVIAVGHTAVASLISIPFARPLHAQMAAVLYGLTAAVVFPAVCCGNDANEFARNLPDIGIEGNKSYLPLVAALLHWFPPFVGYQIMYDLGMQCTLSDACSILEPLKLSGFALVMSTALFVAAAFILDAKYSIPGITDVAHPGDKATVLILYTVLLLYSYTPHCTQTVLILYTILIHL